jgi:hypothetical protein
MVAIGVVESRINKHAGVVGELVTALSHASPAVLQVR